MGSLVCLHRWGMIELKNVICRELKSLRIHSGPFWTRSRNIPICSNRLAKFDEGFDSHRPLELPCFLLVI